MKDEVKIILDIFDKILLKNVDHHLRLNLEPNSTQFKTLKNEIISSELTKLLVKEDLGGAGMTLTDIIPIIQLSAQYGTPVPFIETIISNFLLSELNIKAENDFITLTNKTENILIKKNKISGNFKSIPYLHLAEKILVETEIKNQKYIILFKKGGKLTLQKNFLSEPKFDLDASELEIISMMEKPEPIDVQNLLINVRSIQSFGAMEKILKLCIEYCSQRKQFGRTLSKFQMIQNHISEIALEVAASGASLSTLKNNNKNFYNLKSTAIPKIRTGIASGKVIALSHQVHGAMGFTKEYELSYFTKALNSWRNEFGNEIYWQNILGKLFLNQNKNFWEFLNN